jgi:hypothetical protein
MKQATNRASRVWKGQDLLAACFVQVSCLTYISTLKMEATSSSETSIDFEQAKWVVPQKIEFVK